MMREGVQSIKRPSDQTLEEKHHVSQPLGSAGQAIVRTEADQTVPSQTTSPVPSHRTLDTSPFGAWPATSPHPTPALHSSTNLGHEFGANATSSMSEGNTFLQRIDEWRQLATTMPKSHHSLSPYAAIPHRSVVSSWLDALKASVLHHCFASDLSLPNRMDDVTDAEVTEFVASLNPPPYLTGHQRMLFSELLQNMEAWWSSSFGVMQSIHEDSVQIMGFDALPVPPSPLPMQIQRRLKMIFRSVMQLMRIPPAPANMLGGNSAAEDVSHPCAPDDVRFWRMLGQEHRNNPKMVLREWLFQHFDRPYPTDQDKHLLSSITGLSRTQVSNWFINARVRIWQPLVMELGKELGEHEDMGDSAEEASPLGLKVEVDHQRLVRGSVVQESDHLSPVTSYRDLTSQPFCTFATAPAGVAAVIPPESPDHAGSAHSKLE